MQTYSDIINWDFRRQILCHGKANKNVFSYAILPNILSLFCLNDNLIFLDDIVILVTNNFLISQIVNTHSSADNSMTNIITV